MVLARVHQTGNRDAVLECDAVVVKSSHQAIPAQSDLLLGVELTRTHVILLILAFLSLLLISFAPVSIRVYSPVVALWTRVYSARLSEAKLTKNRVSPFR